MKTKSNPTVSHQLELVGVVSWTWVGLGFDKSLLKGDGDGGRRRDCRLYIVNDIYWLNHDQV